MTIPSDLTAQPAGPGPAPRSPAAPASFGYGRTFWFTYLGNLTVMIAITLLYRYADFVLHLGGNELDLGWIVGVGMVGSLLMRFIQARWIDLYGARLIWLGSLVLLVVSVLGHLLVTDIHSPTIYLLRIAFSTSVAGAVGASITFVSRSLPVARMAEVIGTLGTSGFLAMLVGPAIGDFLCGGAHDVPLWRLNLMFEIAAALGGCSFVCAALATSGESRPAPRRRPPLLWLLSRYHPGPILPVAVAVGVGAALPAVFLPMFADQLKIGRIADFFVVYACTAFLTRLATRSFPYRFGVKPMIYWGMAAHIVSLLSYVVVTRAWHLALPAFFGGIAHAFLFPSVVASGSGVFPNRHRGLGTLAMLATVDLGNVIGSPAVGLLLYYGERLNLPAYPAMFVTVAMLMAVSVACYALLSRPKVSQPAREAAAVAMN